MKKENKKAKKQHTDSVLEKINTGDALENESSSLLEDANQNTNPNKGETGKALQMNEHSNKDINKDKKD